MREYQALPERDREAFTRLISLLFDQTFLVREVWDAKESRLVGNRDYRFAERVRPLMEDYLRVSGWALQVDAQRGVMALYNRFGHNRQPLDKLTTYFLFVLRLMYEEAMAHVSVRREVIVSLRDVLEKLTALGLLERKLGATALQNVLQRLRRWSILERIDGELAHPDSRYILYPTIRILVSEERINQLTQALESAELNDEDGEHGVEDVDVDVDVDEVQDEDGDVDEPAGEDSPLLQKAAEEVGE